MPKSRLASLMVLLLSVAALPLCAQPAVPRVGCAAEWLKPTDILVHTPQQELFVGVIHPEAALFERPFSITGAGAEHRAYIALLEKQGARVHTVVATLLAGTMDKAGRALPGPALDQLREFAGQFVTIDAAALSADERAEQTAYLHKTLAQLHPQELVQCILQCPTVHLRKSEVANTRYSATYEVAPVMNLYFCRDQQITTAKRVVVGRMNSEQRRVETRIMEFVLRKLGVRPIYQVTGEGRLEGGDFIPVGDTALLGQGLRTNAEGVRQLLEHNVFGTPRVVIVKEPWHNQDQMHLDTYFNLIGPKLAVLVKERMDIRDAAGNITQPARPDRRCKVDVYELKDGRYERTTTDGDFQGFLEQQLGLRLIPVSNEDQLKYGINFLCVGPNRLLGIDGVSAEYKQALRDAGVHVTWMDFGNLTGGYGAAHCSTQVLHRR